jgi:mercuric ion transport protein
MTRDGKLIGIGGAGAVVAAICCFTPALVLLLGVLGLSALVGWWLDLILFPALAIFTGVAAYGLYLRRRASTGIAAGAEGD